MTALAAEVIWTRLLSLHFGATVYTFSLILAVFLMGLGIGSTIGASIARNLGDARRALGWCQLLLCGAMAWAAYELTESLRTGRSIRTSPTTPWFTLQLDLARCLWVVLPGRSCGAQLPAGAGGGRHHRTGCRVAGERGLRREHGRCHHRLAGDELRAGPLDRQLAFRAGLDHRVRALGAHPARAVVCGCQ